MAESGRTVRVSGLPTDMEDNRLRDKLFIHFLRPRNGGGEIDSVTIVKATPLSALIKFEDSTVAQRVIQRGCHLLEVDGKKYTLTASEHLESLDPDKIILNLSATVDYSRLPGGIAALASQRDVQIRYADTEERCMLSGSYSKVLAVLAQLLGHPGGAESSDNKESARATPSGSWTSQKPHKQKSDDQSRKTNKQKEKNNNGMLLDEYSSSSSRDLTPGNYSWEHNTALPPPATSVEDLSLILDADLFQYLQKCCQKEYQRILSQYGVEVIDETNQGLTTLFLQAAETAGMEDRRGQERLKRARKAISQLYQENESKICRGQLLKVSLSPRGGLQRAMENLSLRFPKLLLNEDELNIYLIGSRSDVSEAKHSLLLDYNEVKNKRDDVASLVRYPSYDFGSSSSHADEEGDPVRTPSSVRSLYERTDEMLRSEEDESRAEGARRYKLAARFKDSGLAPLGNLKTDFLLRGNSASSRPTRVGPMLGHDVLSEISGFSGETVPRAVAENTEGDILFKVGATLTPSAAIQTKTSFSADMMDAPPRISTSPYSTNHSSLSGNTASPPVGSGSTLRRANSFSGTPQQKAQVVGHKIHDDSSKSSVKARERSSSFSSQTGRDRKEEIYNAEIPVTQVMWYYIKEAYRTRVEDLTSDVQMTESPSETDRELTLILRGADSYTVRSCQHGLQKLIDSVKFDFSVQELRLSELGITDTTDETLQACCSEVKSRFKKVTFHMMKNKVYFVGPQKMCSQVVATLWEVFSGESEQHPFSFSQINAHQSTNVPASSNFKALQRTPTGNADGTSGNQEWKSTYTSDFCEMQAVNGSIGQSSVKQDHVTKEKVTIADTTEVDRNRNDTSLSPVDGGEKETPICATQTDSTGQNQSTPEESRSSPGDWIHICVCGKNGTSLMRTKCGVSICSKCLETVHAKCRVCNETEQTSWGIQGEMKKSRLSISLPGHSKDCIIKITYRIPDGIQGEGHPSPGKPFKGGVFEAYLPECETAKKLLPRLEKAFKQGLTFTVTGKDTEARVTWDSIPHKTSLQGGKARKGYPDSTYLTRLSAVLTGHGIEETSAKSHK